MEAVAGNIAGVNPMHSFADLARELNRSPVYLRGLQTRFELPLLEGAAYSDSYLAFLRTIVFLRTLNVSEDALLCSALSPKRQGETPYHAPSPAKSAARHR